LIQASSSQHVVAGFLEGAEGLGLDPLGVWGTDLVGDKVQTI
jgi:hypothetical protein